MPDPTGPGVAIAKDKPTRLINSPNEQTHRTIRNAGANPVQLSRDSGVTFGGANPGFKLAAAGEQRVVVNPGESIYAICGTGLESAIEII